MTRPRARALAPLVELAAEAVGDASAWLEVVGDPDVPRPARGAVAPAVRWLARDLDDAAAPVTPPFDAATCVDVLSRVASVGVSLARLRACVAPGARLFFAEPRAFVEQRLEAPRRRAFSPRALVARLRGAGFACDAAATVDVGAYLAIAATRADDPAFDALAEAHAVFAAGDAERAAELWSRAAASSDTAARLEAALGLAALALARGDGDGAARGYMAAAKVDPTDPRPLAGLSHVARCGGLHADALELALRARALDPTDAHATTAWASAVDRVAPGASERAWSIAARLDPASPDVAVRLANVAQGRSGAEQALAALARATEHAPPTVEHAAATVRALAACERPADAELELRVAEARFGAHPRLAALRAALAEA